MPTGSQKIAIGLPTMGEGALGEFIQQLLLLLVRPRSGFLAVFVDQLAQRLDPLVALAPKSAGSLQALLVPAQGLALLLDGRLHLPHEALVVEQPFPPHAGPALLAPALGVLAAIMLQVPQP